MQNIYDNGRLCLGEVGKIRQYLIDNAEETWEIEDILAELKELEDNTIVAINYDNIVIWKKGENKLDYNEVACLECNFEIGDITLEKEYFDFLNEDYMIKFIY